MNRGKLLKLAATTAAHTANGRFRIPPSMKPVRHSLRANTWSTILHSCPGLRRKTLGLGPVPVDFVSAQWNQKSILFRSFEHLFRAHGNELRHWKVLRFIHHGSNPRP